MEEDFLRQVDRFPTFPPGLQEFGADDQEIVAALLDFLQNFFFWGATANLSLKGYALGLAPLPQGFQGGYTLFPEGSVQVLPAGLPANGIKRMGELLKKRVDDEEPPRWA